MSTVARQIALVFLLLGGGAAGAQGPDEKSGTGFFFYDDPEPPPEAEPEPEPDPEEGADDRGEERTVEPPQEETATELDEPNEGPEAFSVAWFKENYPRVRQAAMDDPQNEKKMRAYLYMTKLMFDKSSRFAHKARAMSLTDPVMDVNREMPWNAIGKTEFLRARQEGRRDALEYLASTSGLWFFFDSTCRFCKSQAPLIKKVAERYGFTLFNISTDGKGLPALNGRYRVDKGQAKRFQVSTVPAIMLVTPPDSYVVVSQGMLGIEEIENRLIIAAAHKDLLPDDILDKAQPSRQNTLTADAIRGAENALDGSSDPSEWVAYIRRSLGYEDIQ